MLHRCDHATPGERTGLPVQRLPWRTIDVHCHLFTPAVEKLVAGHPEKVTSMVLETESMGIASARVNAAMIGSLIPKLTSVATRLQDMDAMGVDVQAISGSPNQTYYWADPDLSEQIVDLQNEEISALCSAHPSRFVGLGTVGLQNPSRAAEQIEQLISVRGFKGVQISTMVNGRDIADRCFDPFWAKAEELGATVFVHPWGTTLGRRLADHYLMNTIGQPLETTICLSKLIFGGTLDRHQGLKIIAAHAGGYLPFYAGRSDHAFLVRPEARDCSNRPSDYFRRVWFDSVVYEPRSLSTLVEQVGASQVVLGTDYPFDMGHYDIPGMIGDFATQTQRAILGENAALLLGIR